MERIRCPLNRYAEKTQDVCSPIDDETRLKSKEKKVSPINCSLSIARFNLNFFKIRNQQIQKTSSDDDERFIIVHHMMTNLQNL